MEEKNLTINGLSVNYKVFSPSFAKAKESGCLFVLHGWGTGSDAWAGAAELLEKEGYRVIVPDMPGFGKSDAPGYAWNVDDYVRWTKEFIEALNLSNFALIGHSFGGQVAVKFCALYPQKVDKLVLCAAAAIRKPRLGSRQLVAKYLAKTKIIFKNIPLGIYPVLRKIVYLIAGTKDYSRLRGVMAQTFLNVVKEGVLESAQKITVPTLIVWGDKDNETPLEDAYEINKAIPGSKLEIIKGAGHKLHRTHTQVLAKIIILFFSAGGGCASGAKS